jgi:predicted CXXCH cytochrome family protein
MKPLTILLVTLLLLITGGSAFAVDDPHGSANSIYCEQCHISHSTLGDILINSTDSLVSTLCLSCHTPGGWAGMTKVMSSSLKADPGVSGTSHSWDVPADNVDHGAEMPQSQTLLDHLRADDRITCGTCHDPHSNTISPFLRLDNSADQLCLDCHRSREMTSVKTYTGTDLSHPVGIALPLAGAYHNPPLDTDGNPQPSDGNTTNDFILGGSDEVRCTSCHGVHYTDSNSGTVDGP